MEKLFSVDSSVCVRTCDTEGLFSRPLLARLSRPLSEENRPFFRCLQVRDSERLLSVASSLEQIWSRRAHARALRMAVEIHNLR